MSKITRKLVLSLLTVVLTVVALGTTTFAWFTLTNTATVQPFDAEIQSDEGIEIALTDAADPLLYNWKTTILTQDVYDYMTAKYTLFRFSSVTSANGTSFNDLDGSVSALGGKYLELNLHFRSNTATEISMDDFSLSSTPFSWTSSNATFTNEHGISITSGASFDVNAADAFRMSVTGLISSSPVTTVYENPTSTTNVNLPSGTAAADLSATNGSVDFYNQVTGGVPTGAASVTVPDAINAIDDTTNLLKVMDMASGQTGTAGADYYGSITIRIWFEGWDPNAYNVLLAETISASMHFTA